MKQAGAGMAAAFTGTTTRPGATPICPAGMITEPAAPWARSTLQALESGRAGALKPLKLGAPFRRRQVFQVNVA